MTMSMIPRSHALSHVCAVCVSALRRDSRRNASRLHTQRVGMQQLAPCRFIAAIFLAAQNNILKKNHD